MVKSYLKNSDAQTHFKWIMEYIFNNLKENDTFIFLPLSLLEPGESKEEQYMNNVISSYIRNKHPLFLKLDNVIESSKIPIKDVDYTNLLKLYNYSIINLGEFKEQEANKLILDYLNTYQPQPQVAAGRSEIKTKKRKFKKNQKKRIDLKKCVNN